MSGDSHRIQRPDGRMLAGASFGPATGRPVLFIAGAATSRRMTFGSDLLDDLNVRLLTMDRPGIGDSTPDDGRTLASTAEDYRAFVAGVLGDENTVIPVVANSQGAVFGLKLASAGGARSLTLVSPADELSHPAIHAMLPAEATSLADLALGAPERAAEVLAGFSAQAMQEMVAMGSHPADVAFYAAPPFSALYRRALDEGFAHGGVGYVRDTMIAMRPWEIDLAEIHCSVRILFGALDRGHSPDLGETLAGRIPNATRTVIDDAGGAALWTHARIVLDSILSADRPVPLEKSPVSPTSDEQER